MIIVALHSLSKRFSHVLLQLLTAVRSSVLWVGSILMSPCCDLEGIAGVYNLIFTDKLLVDDAATGKAV